MPTTQLERNPEIKPDISNKEAVKQILLNEVFLRLKLSESGIRFIPEEIKKFKSESSLGFRGNRRNVGESVSFELPHGVNASGALNRWSRYSLVVEDGKPILYDEDDAIGEVSFPKPNPAIEELAAQRLSGGEKFREIAGVNAQGGIHVGYSTECSLADAGEACYFCTKAIEGDYTGDAGLIKTPRQVADAYEAARKAGYGNHFRITGGFVPERRELEYYLDVADAIKERYASFYSVAIIGAPADLSIIDKYKEAGYTNISHNIEIWDKDIFAALCPGKEKRNGGWQHWVDALEYSAKVFGKGNVHSNLVGGLAPKHTTLEGVEYLASKGVICHFSAFRPVPGTPLAGYRSPEAAWHWDLLQKGTEIFRRYGFTTLQLFSGPASGPHSGDVFRINAGEFEGDRLPVWKYPVLD
jgi:hypothetical protein